MFEWATIRVILGLLKSASDAVASVAKAIYAKMLKAAGRAEERADNLERINDALEGDNKIDEEVEAKTDDEVMQDLEQDFRP